MAKRPSLFIALAFCLGIGLERMLQLPWEILAIGFNPIIGGALFFYWQQQAKISQQRIFGLVDGLLLVGCLAAGMLRTHFAETPAKHDIGYFINSSAEVLLFGKVQNLPEPRGERWQFQLAAQRVRTKSGWAATRGVALVIADSLKDVQIDEKLLLRGFLRLADGSRNPGAFDYRAYLQAQDISAIFRCRDQTPLWHEKPSQGISWRQIVGQAQSWIKSQLAGFSQGQRLALLAGLLIGERDEISHEVLEAFRRTGLVHILAVSGSNVGFVALILFVVLSFLRMPRRWYPYFLLSGIIFYMFLTGAQPPVVRASVMAIVIIVGESLERDSDIYNSLGVAALLILLWQPLQLFQLGFQLSFAAVVGIAYLYRPLSLFFRRLLRFRWLPLRLAIAVMAISFAAQLATLPISLHAFGRLPLAAIWGNLIIIPAAFIIVATTTAACAFSFFEFVSHAFGIVADLTSGAMIAFTRWLADIPLAYIDGIHVSPWLLLFYVIVMVTLVEWRRSRSARPWLLATGFLVLNIFVWQKAWSAAPKLRVTFFDVGQGDAALIEFPKGRMLIDTGPLYEKADAAKWVLVPFFQRNGIRELDAVVISHPHADHLGGLPTLLREINIKKVFVCGAETDSLLEQNCENLLDSLKVPSFTLNAGQHLDDFAPTEVWALHPRREEKKFLQLNDVSVIIKVIFGQHAFLFPGDAEFEGESHLLQFARLLDSDVLKVGHHGSSTSSMPLFLNAVSPQWAITSVGRWNRFGHPDPQVMARYDSLGIRLLRTDRDGAVIFETDGKTLKRIR